MKIYYAHSNKEINSPVHRRREIFLKETFGKVAEVIDPSHDLPLGMLSNQYIDYALNECGLVIATEYLDFIGRGVYTILSKCIQQDHKPRAILMREDEDKLGVSFYLVREVALVEPSDWVVRYGKVTVTREVKLLDLIELLTSKNIPDAEDKKV
ncbi:hypothetical protein LCGC14_0245860 [marine sediment metagenome]|uniref:Uncharacterized protein n=1 Tax=marine sediment metagenome TaxID=412755 RepID=A0A0F9U651_9ZZZZ